MSTRSGLKQQLQDALQQALQTQSPAGEFWVRRAHGTRHGEFSSNAALVTAAQKGEDVSILAPQLLKHLPQGWQERNGFLNFHMNDELLKQATERALREGERFGAGTALAGKRMVVEFVSADPSGPLPFGLGRIAAVGDAVCRLLTLQGANVTREFYLNDDQTSAKMRLLGESIASHYLSALGQEHEPPEGILNDRFVRDIADTIAREDSSKYLLLPDEERSALFAQRARDTAVAAQKAVLTRFGVAFDVWTSEAALAREGRVEAALHKLRERGHVYTRDGAEWLRTTQFGDEADRVLVRANGRPTYLASDIAYHVLRTSAALMCCSTSGRANIVPTSNARVPH
jgi:arginyl-tRNA synthetase